MRPLRVVWRLTKWLLAAGAVIVLPLLVPVAYVELACRGDARADRYQPLITDPAFRRPEANTFLTYPEWHIVYAYDGLAHVLRTTDEYAFDYFSSIAGFWRSSCALMRLADAHGGADANTRTMIHTIGVSFTAELAAKAAYEETVGRAAAWWRGPEKTPEDQVVAAIAADYAAFLRQTPWYAYPFGRKTTELWDAPLGDSLRAWERRLAIGLEFTAKRAYARLIAGAAATAPAPLTIRSVVAGMDEAALAPVAGVTVVGRRGAGIEIETPRYDRFTRLVAELAGRGGNFLEIAGNDDIMVSLAAPAGAAAAVPHGAVILRMRRDGFPGDRLLVAVKVADLASLARALPPGDPGLEHVFDY